MPGRPVQLGFLVPGVRLPKAARLLLPAQRKEQLTAEETLDEVVPTPARWTWLARRPLAQPVSPHLVDPAQLSLFQARRDWRCLAVGALDQLPVAHSSRRGPGRRSSSSTRGPAGWNASPRNAGARTLRILLAWVGADAPIHEADIRALSQRRSTTIRRVLQFLDERGMVIPDPARQGTAVERAIQHRIQTLPDPIAGELRRWVQVVRGQGRREHQQLPFTTIRSYLNCFYPVLVSLGRAASPACARSPATTSRRLSTSGRPSRRAICCPHCTACSGRSNKNGSSSGTRARGISLSAMRRLPVPIPTDQLRGLIDRAEAPMAKLIVALIAIHALGKKETSQLLLADLDLPAGRMLVRRAAGGTPSISTNSPTRSPSAGSANDTAAGPSPPTPTFWSAR